MVTPGSLPQPRPQPRPFDRVAGVADGVLAAMPAPLGCLDPAGRVVLVNTKLELLLDRPAPDVLGRPVTDVLAAGTAAAVTSACHAALTSGAPVSLEVLEPGGGAGWSALHAWPTADGAAFVFVDVTARRLAQDEAESARRAAERAGARTALLAAVAGELSSALDSTSALGSLARLVVPALADGCVVTVVDREGRARDVGSWHADPARRPLLDHYAQVRLDTLPPASPVARALRSGSEAQEPVAAVLALMPPGPARDLLEVLGPATALVLPLTADGRAVGVLTLYLDPGRTLDDDDLRTAREVAAQAGRTVDRVHRQSQQAKLAEELQRSLLTDPPTIAGAQVATRYVPAAEAARVGGDWYDAFLHPEGDPVVVIGDVAGHDTAAAAEMGQLRGLLRGIAHYSGAGPAEVLRGLDAAMDAMHTGTLATAAIARLEHGGTLLRWASAGHPPPLVADPDGTVTVLADGLGDLLLGVDATAVRRESTVPLRPGAVVLLYTDGLVERRDCDVDTGVARLRRHLAALTGLPLEELADALLARMLPATPQDDVALVAICVHPAD
ncbi:SpoIIE family protein phosphatase [Geodermatophilus poikilotrophus]|uniref:Serine phosphatase RsbU, regulator of sigma subunit n=1 Tax=Geodermatophilus poikilotrophus TaxID=1333667 RepID=A0A1I0GJB7_9ACTN|nr:SpoIIE family protein phosphatase [Geodermatophilus poikilotrophus]SET70126.1 Serine phosphatase RsbU, regulator of sigma subunit [Geodermatophilus poikilotrophus]